MNLRRGNRKQWFRASTGINLSVLVVVTALLGLMIVLVRSKLLQNTQRLGDSLVQSYAVEEESLINDLSVNVQIAVQYIDEISADGGNMDQIQAWLQSYFSKLTDIMGEGLIDTYAVIDGTIVASNPWEGDADYDYENTVWYTMAMESPDEVVYTDVYEDAITGRKILTVCKALEQPGDVFAIDVFIQEPELHGFCSTLPEQASLYLCSEDGMLLYAITPWDKTQDELQSYMDFLFQGIQDGSLYHYDASFQDPEGVERGAYYYTMDNGWTVIMTLPINSILLGEWNSMFYFLLSIAVFLFLVLAFMTIRDALKDRAMKKADDTAHMLGDSFYSIFRVNFREGRYESIKSYPDIREAMPETGSYEEFLSTVQDYVKSDTYLEFRKNFSLSSIRKRVEQGIADYGGDYQRRFGEEYRWVNIRTLYDPNRAPDEVILCFRDVDIEKRQQLQHMIILQEALEEARKSTKARTDFFNGMSHDMRTPLNAILGCSALARRYEEAGEQGRVTDYLNKIETAGKQLLALINDVLEFARVDAKAVSHRQTEFNLRELLETTAGLFSARAQELDRRFVTDFRIEDEVVVSDKLKITQILNNLLSNAFKYSQEGAEIRLEVRQFTFQKYSKYQIVVQDTGFGMSKEFLEHLFEPYTREATFHTMSTVGTGLGMAIVKSVVQQLSGEISVESELGKGSRFTVTLPLKVAEQQPVHDPDAAPADDSPFDWSDHTVLVAEDNALNSEIVQEVLSAHGATVIAAADGEEAVRLFSASALYAIDVILMDMQMPKLDGCGAASAIRALNREDASWVLIVAVTANAFAQDVARTTQAGMDGHVSKPIDFDLLGQTLQKLIRERARKRDVPSAKNDAGSAVI